MDSTGNLRPGVDTARAAAAAGTRGVFPPDAFRSAGTAEGGESGRAAARFGNSGGRNHGMDSAGPLRPCVCPAPACAAAGTRGAIPPASVRSAGITEGGESGGAEARPGNNGGRERGMDHAGPLHQSVDDDRAGAPAGARGASRPGSLRAAKAAEGGESGGGAPIRLGMAIC